MSNYTRINWEDLPSTDTPINAENLNIMDEGIADLATEIESYSNTISEMAETLELLERRYDTLRQGIEDLSDLIPSGDGTCYFDSNGNASGPVKSGYPITCSSVGIVPSSAAFRAINDSTNGTRTGAGFYAKNSERAVSFGISQVGDVVIRDYTLGTASPTSETPEQAYYDILRASKPEGRQMRTLEGGYKVDTVYGMEVRIPHKFFCKTYDDIARPPVLSRNTLGYRILRMETAKTGNALYVYGDWGNNDYWSGNADATTYKWDSTAGWPEDNYPRGSVSVSGNTVAMAINVSASDIRLKDNVQDSVLDALDLVNSMQCRQFDWKQTGVHWDVGLVADELEELDPKLANGGGFDEEGNMVIKNIDLLYLNGVLVKAVQQLTERVNALETKKAIEAMMKTEE